jgi:hypothetical protein
MYTISHYVKAKDCGKVDGEFFTLFQEQWWNVTKKNLRKIRSAQAPHYKHRDGVTDDEDENDGDENDEDQEGRGNTETQYLEWVTAIAPFHDEEGDYILELCRGDSIGVTKVANEHWWMGFNTRTSETGYFPLSYVKRDVTTSQ